MKELTNSQYDLIVKRDKDDEMIEKFDSYSLRGFP